MTVVSEADLKIGGPFIVVNRASGQVLEHENLDAGNVPRHPARPLVYLSFFRRRDQLMLYDLESRRVSHTAPLICAQSGWRSGSRPTRCS